VAGYGSTLLLDWSAYARVLLARAGRPSGRRLPESALSRFEDAVLADELYVCTPFRLEARYSAQSAADFAAISAELAGFQSARVDADTWLIAEQAQQRLAEAPAIAHRVKLADLLVAAIASRHGLGILHYDHDYDVIAEHAQLGGPSMWIAPAGTVD
jgi:predicted nucleic acid-binding protein